LHPGPPLCTELHMHMQIHATYREVTNPFESCDLDTFSKFAKDFFPDVWCSREEITRLGQSNRSPVGITTFAHTGSCMIMRIFELFCQR
jgi:hypothetical protein